MFSILSCVIPVIHGDYVLYFREEYLAKVEKRIKDWKVEILNEPRDGKKLLVLDIDYTLFGKGTLS